MILITGGAYQGKEEFARGLLRGQQKESLEYCGLQPGEFGGRLPYSADCESVSAADGAAASWEELAGAALITNFHLWTKRLLAEGKDVSAMAEKLADENPDVVLTVNELGCGIVPADAFDRRWRELTGRACCALAKRAEAVYRVTCGIAVRLR